MNYHRNLKRVFLINKRKSASLVEDITNASIFKFSFFTEEETENE